MSSWACIRLGLVLIRFLFRPATQKARYWTSWGWDGDKAAKALLEEQVRAKELRAPVPWSLQCSTFIGIICYLCQVCADSAGPAYATGVVNSQCLGLAYLTDIPVQEQSELATQQWHAAWLVQQDGGGLRGWLTSSCTRG
jgi:hypothetical protein